MYKPFLQVAALFGAISVALGAFGAHALKKMVDESVVNIFETAVKYQFYHVFALMASAILYKEYSNKWMIWSGNLFITGIILFSGSLYFLTYIKGTAKTGLDWVGAITPLGGLAFIVGWCCMFIAMYRSVS